jgi:hypothetical protein
VALPALAVITVLITEEPPDGHMVAELVELP